MPRKPLYIAPSPADIPDVWDKCGQRIDKRSPAIHRAPRDAAASAVQRRAQSVSPLVFPPLAYMTWEAERFASDPEHESIINLIVEDITASGDRSGVVAGDLFDASGLFCRLLAAGGSSAFPAAL